MAVKRSEPSQQPTPRDDLRLQVARTLGTLGVLAIGASIVRRVFYDASWLQAAAFLAAWLLLLAGAWVTGNKVLSRLVTMPGQPASAPVATTAPRWGQRTRPVMSPAPPRPRTPAQIMASKDERVVAEATVAQTSITRRKVIPMPFVGAGVLALAPAGYRPIGWTLLVGGLLLVTVVEFTRHKARRDLHELDARDLEDKARREAKARAKKTRKKKTQKKPR